MIYEEKMYNGINSYKDIHVQFIIRNRNYCDLVDLNRYIYFIRLGPLFLYVLILLHQLTLKVDAWITLR